MNVMLYQLTNNLNNLIYYIKTYKTFHLLTTPTYNKFPNYERVFFTHNNVITVRTLKTYKTDNELFMYPFNYFLTCSIC